MTETEITASNPSQPMKFNMEVIDGSLPQEVLVEILSRLPVRSLGRFRCLCKSWRSSISSSYFVKKHTSVTVGDRSRLKFLSSLKVSRFIDYEELLNNDPDDIYLIRPILSPKLRCKDDVDRFLLDDNRFHNEVVGSCNGLICLSCRDDQEQNRDDVYFFVFWNPSTGDTCSLPGTTSIYYNYFGFGYDSTTEDYKIIAGDNYKSAIFSQKEGGSWRTVECQEHYDFHGSGCLVNEALHWLQDGRIISFELAKETFQEVARLTDFYDKDDLQRFAGIGKTVGNCLFAFVPDLVRDSADSDGGYDSVGYPIAGTIWVMKEYGIKKSWTKLVRIPKPADMYGIACFLPDWILENGKVMMILKRGGLDEVVVYNPKGNTFSRVDYKSDSEYTPLDSTFYIETLVSPKILQ